MVKIKHIRQNPHLYRNKDSKPCMKKSCPFQYGAFLSRIIDFSFVLSAYFGVNIKASLD